MSELTEKLKIAAGEYAHCYSFVGDDTMPRKHKELHSIIDEAGELEKQLLEANAQNMKLCKELSEFVNASTALHDADVIRHALTMCSYFSEGYEFAYYKSDLEEYAEQLRNSVKEGE
jgi:hypothetical protein